MKIFYTWGTTALEKKFDPGFGKIISWDIPLLEGYDYVFEKNIATSPGSHHFKGVNNPELTNHIEEWNANAILVYGWSFKSHLQCLRYFHKRMPVFFRGDSTLLNENKGPKKWARTFFLKWVYRHVDKAFYVGTQNKLYLKKNGLQEYQLIFAPHAIDNTRFFDIDGEYTRKAIEWRSKLGIAEDELVFLLAGKLEAKKDPELLVKAFIAIQQPDTHLIMVGNGILEKELKEKYTSVNKLHFIDFQNQSQMPVIYRLGDVFVLPSAGPGETWGLGVNEAMACNRTVIVSDKVGCAVDLVEEGKNGYTFPAGNVTELVKKMQLLCANKQGLKTMGSASLEKIRNWNYTSVAIAIENEMTK